MIKIPHFIITTVSLIEAHSIYCEGVVPLVPLVPLCPLCPCPSWSFWWPPFGFKLSNSFFTDSETDEVITSIWNHFAFLSYIEKEMFRESTWNKDTFFIRTALFTNRFVRSFEVSLVILECFLDLLCSFLCLWMGRFEIEREMYWPGESLATFFSYSSSYFFFCSSVRGG